MTKNILAVICLFSCLLPAARADFESALAEYHRKDFAAAELEFRRLAELGDAPSQRNLAAMYARGEHVAKDLGVAWAWAALSAETDPEAQSLRDTLGERLTDGEAARAEQMRLTLRASYGPEAVRTRLMPVPAAREADCTVDVTSEATPVHRVAPQYPRTAARDGFEGEVCLQFYLTRKGKPLRGSVRSASAHHETDGRKDARHASAFSVAVLGSLRKASFAPPATEALREVPVGYCVHFGLEGSDKDEWTEIRQLERKAGEGQARSQFELAQIASNNSSHPGLSQANRKRLADTARQLYLHSAVGGYGPSQFLVARQLLTGDQCEKDVDKGLAWLQFAAQQGHNQAQYLLASRLLHGEDVNPDPGKALAWLEAAAKGGHPRARVELARYWLQRSPERRAEALAMLPTKPAPDDIGQLEGAALAAALRGDFPQAASYQREALAIATELEFAVEHRRALLAAFQDQKLLEDIGGPAKSPE